MHDITEPLILSVGSHQKGSGRGCVMNVISWCDGDEVITDFPNSVYPTLARLLQQANDSIGETTDDGIVPAEYAGRLLDIAFAARGTAGADAVAADHFLSSRSWICGAPFEFNANRITADEWLDRLENFIVLFKQVLGFAPVTPPTAVAVDEALAKMATKVDA